MKQQLTLVLGGASSGKSAYAETLVLARATPKVYIATAQAFDAEMQAKIAAHRTSRGAGWQTVDAPHDPVAALDAVAAGNTVLLDCATMWLSNRLLAEADIEAEVPPLIAALTRCAAPVVVVSNELGMSGVPENALARRFRDLQGRLNCQIAAQADLVVAVMAGLPLALKGQLPEVSKW